MSHRERLLDEHADNIEILYFAKDLRRLREKAGNPPYRELARRAHYSAGTLSDAAGGRKLPSLPVTLAYVRACEADAVEWERRWNTVASALASDAVTTRDDTTPAPYRGAAPLRPEDADRFFGRELLLGELLARVRRDRVTAVVGPSGVGKSSLLGAGLVAEVRARSEPVVLFTPGLRPLEECACALADVVGEGPGQVYTSLRADPQNLHWLVRRALAGGSTGSELLIVVDQFEEVHTACRDDAERAGLLDALLAAVRADTSRCRLVLSIRSDQAARCTRYPGLADELCGSPLAIGPMGTDDLRRAIVGSAASAGCVVEGALLATLTAEAAGEDGALPLLAAALRETWYRRRGNTLTLAGYRAAGGIHGLLARVAEPVYTALAPDGQRLARNLLLAMVAPCDDAGGRDRKRPVRRSDVDPEPEAAAVLERLAETRLVTLNTHTIEITHSALINAWPRLHQWVANDRVGMRTHQRLTEAAREWEELGRDTGALYRGARLATTWAWVTRRHPDLLPREREFLDAGRVAEERARSVAACTTHRLRWLTVVLTVSLALSALVAVAWVLLPGRAG